MGNPAGMKRDFAALEKRRFKAVRLVHKRNLSQAEVARRLDVSRQTVSRWVKEFRVGGEKALKKAGRAGRKPELTAGNRIVLEYLLESRPEDLYVQASVWTGRSVADLIEQEFGIRYHPGHVWKILKQLGWTPNNSRSSLDAEGCRKRPKPSRT